MAEWLRPRASIAENGLNIRRISVGSILSLKEVHKLGGWCSNHVPSLLWLALKPIFFKGQDGRVVKAPNFHCRERSKYTPDKRGFDILTLKEDHRLGSWC